MTLLQINLGILASPHERVQTLDVVGLVGVGRPRAVADVPEHAILVHDPGSRWRNHHSPVVISYVWHFYLRG